MWLCCVGCLGLWFLFLCGGWLGFGCGVVVVVCVWDYWRVLGLRIRYRGLDVGCFPNTNSKYDERRKQRSTEAER